MTFDITKYERTSEYNKYLDSLDYNTSCIEQCVYDIEKKFTKHQEESKPIRTVIYGDPQSGKTSMMIGLCAKFIDLSLYSLDIHFLIRSYPKLVIRFP